MASNNYSFTLMLSEIMSLEVLFRSTTRAQILSRLEKGDIQLNPESYWPNIPKNV